MDVHGPYRAPPPYDKLFSRPYNGQYAGQRHNFYGPKPPAPEDILYVKGIYDQCVRHNDDRFGELLNKLDKLGLLGRTLIVVTADHGQAFYEHEQWAHQVSLYNEELLVPLIFWLPGVITADNVVEQYISSLDIMPTVLEIAGIPEVKGTQGVSLAPLLCGEKNIERKEPYIFAERFHSEPGLAIFDYPCKGNYTYAKKDPFQGLFELYDLADDPKEQHDLADEKPDLAAQLLKVSHGYLRSTLKQPQTEEIHMLDLEQQKLLKSLGYIQ